MATKLRNLRLISGETPSTAADAHSATTNFSLISVNELTAAEQRLVEQLVNRAVPGAGLIAVARTLQTWDLRPIVMKVGEAQPSVLRLSCPLGTNNPDAMLRLQASFDRVKMALADSDALFEWGSYDGQLWYRRTLHHSTLAQQLPHIDWTTENILIFFQQLIEQVISLHAYGVVHGHIASSNIALDERGRPILLDTAIAHAQLQSGCSRELSAAPELAQSMGTLLPSVDVFGVAQICKRILLKAQRNVVEGRAGEELLLDALSERLEPMLQYSPQARPPLHEVLTKLRELQGFKPVVADPSSKGRILFQAPEETPQKQMPLNEPLRSENSAQPASLQVEASPIAQRPPLHADAQLQKTHSVVQEKKSMWWVYTIGLFSIAFCAWSAHQRFFSGPLEPDVDANELRVAWSSGLPSQMQPVVVLAVEYPQSFAEQLVVRSALKGEQLPQGINTDLLRLAFDSRWEAKLNDSDRRAAMTLATLRFVSHKDTSVLKELPNLHPGVIFAITASAPASANSSLSKISAERLRGLPQPLGEAFSVVAAGKTAATAADEGIRGIARFAAFGLSSPAEISLFLQEDFAPRLQALALLTSASEIGSQQVLDALLAHPNVEFSHPQVVWAKKWSLEHWKIAKSAKLRLLAGFLPTQSLDTSYIGALFAHPSAAVRKYAVSEARDRIAFAHPASLRVLTILIEQPELLSPEQLMQLAKLLENPANSNATELTKWIATAPAVEILQELLIATAGRPSATLVDTFVAMQLNEQKWQPTNEQLQVLIQHPDEYTRMMVYRQLFNEPSQASFDLLQQAVRTEKNEAYREQLALMLEQLHGMLNPSS